MVTYKHCCCSWKRWNNWKGLWMGAFWLQQGCPAWWWGGGGNWRLDYLLFFLNHCSGKIEFHLDILFLFHMFEAENYLCLAICIMSAIVVANACTWGSPLSSILTLFMSLYTFSMVAVFCHSNLSMVVSPSGNNFAFIGGPREVNNDSCTRLLLSKCLAALDTPILQNQKQSPPQEGFGGLGGRGLDHLVDFDSTCLMPQYRFWHMACIESWYLIPQYLNRCFRLAVFPDVVTFLKHFLLYCEVGCTSWTRFCLLRALGHLPVLLNRKRWHPNILFSF